jgi:hypothetical protein
MNWELVSHTVCHWDKGHCMIHIQGKFKNCNSKMQSSLSHYLQTACIQVLCLMIRVALLCLASSDLSETSGKV